VFVFHEGLILSDASEWFCLIYYKRLGDYPKGDITKDEEPEKQWRDIIETHAVGLNKF
jgi:hypothetical protein